MKKKGLMFIVGVVILSGIFGGCVGAPVERNENHQNLPDINDYDAIFVGEDHSNAESFIIELDLMKYYYNLGIRDFAFEFGSGTVLLLQYYLETGEEECLEVVFNNLKGTAICSLEAFQFWKDIYAWNLTLDEKVKLYGFDVEHQYMNGISAMWLFILRKYERIDGIPMITARGNRSDLINDFKNNPNRYSIISDEDLILLEKLILNAEQAENYYSSSNSIHIREQYMIDNFLNIIENISGQKIFAIMGSDHSSLTGYALFPETLSMANVLKEKIKIASIALHPYEKPDEWPYTIIVNSGVKTTPYDSNYNGRWPFSL